MTPGDDSEGLRVATLYTLQDAGQRLGIPRDLVTYLVADREIPFTLVGRSKVLDDSGLAALRHAHVDYRRKLGRIATPA